MNRITLICFIIPSCFSVSCEKERASKKVVSNTLINPDTKALNGNKLTFGYFSDTLDEGLTIQSAKKAFGNDPLIFVNGEITELKYAVDTDKIYENGLRITTISITFSKGVMVDASVGFNRFSE